MIRTFHTVAIIGLVSSASVHILSLFRVDVQQYFPGVMLLHIVGIILFFFAVHYLNKIVKRENRRRISPLEVISGLEEPLRTMFSAKLALVLFIYGFVNFFYVFSHNEGSIGQEFGKYYYHIHGRFIRYITEEEFHTANAGELRGFSGHWMLFFCMEMAIFEYLWNRKQKVVE